MESTITNGTSLVEENKDLSSLPEVTLKPKNEVPKNVPKNSSSFAEMRSGFSEEMNHFLVSGDIEKLKQKWSSYQAKDITKRVSMEQAVRDKTVMLINNSNQPKYIDDLKKLLNGVILLCKNELATVLFSVNILSDIIDTSTLAVCEKLFDFIEDNLPTWKSNTFFTACKNNILRVCNDLLRRLSKAQNTIFCGRILLFLAVFFPFSERSGLNIVSDFNVDNLHKYDPKFDPSEESIEIVDVSTKVDNNFHSKFWTLQDFFRNPNHCYNKTQWKEFVEITNMVLGTFKKNKLTRESVDRLCLKYRSQYFTKFLTSHKLLVLQLSDSNFRRTICLQLLMLFQYLTGQIKTKPENNELSAEENEWIKETTEKTYSILKDTPPDGEEFLTVAKNMIMREDEWSNWKNEGCPALKKVTQENELSRHPRVEDNLGQRSFSILTAQATTGADTIFVPSKTGPPQAMSLKHTFDEYIASLTPAPELKDFLSEAIEESERKIEPEKKKVADPSFAWLSVKLISLKAPTFFSNSHSPVPSMSEYVDIMCKKMYRDLNPGLLLPPIMPAPKSAAIKTKKPGSKTITATNSLTTSLKKRMKKTKVGEGDKAVVKIVKGGVVKLVKTAKGIKVVKGSDESESSTLTEITKNGSSSPQEKPEESKIVEKPKIEKEKVTNNTQKVVKISSTSSNDKATVKKPEKPVERTIEKSPDNNFVKPANPVKNDKYKSEKVSKSPSPKPQKKSDEKVKKDEKRIEKREEKKNDKRDDRRERSDSRSRERSVESRREKSTDRPSDKGKSLVKSPGKRKASPKRDDHKSSKLIRDNDYN
ncbi:THO complex subunit 1 [Halyomorpha halys]|uniref:THO complex subunit 1 n=1 Tax=Halyomorpha halys TaxID=286706 RepID=UPI0006D4F881|nr:THO complex subunit 1 isoform X1 [Halyomorpha halys]